MVTLNDKLANVGMDAGNGNGKQGLSAIKVGRICPLAACVNSRAGVLCPRLGQTRVASLAEPLLNKNTPNDNAKLRALQCEMRWTTHG